MPSERSGTLFNRERLPKQGVKRFEKTGVEADSHDRGLVVKVRVGSKVGGVRITAQSSIMQPATRVISPAELMDLVMAALLW